jgi:phage shock protein E
MPLLRSLRRKGEAQAINRALRWSLGRQGEAQATNRALRWGLGEGANGQPALDSRRGPGRLSGHEHKHDDVRCVQFGLWRGARRENPKSKPMKKILTTIGLAVTMGFSGPARAGEGATQGGQAQKASSPQLVDVKGAEDLLASKKVVILDVRTPEEFAAGHLQGATNVDFRSKDFQKNVEKLPKDRSYLVHCAMGGRSARAAALLSSLEFKSVYDLKGGITAWEKAGKPVVKP